MNIAFPVLILTLALLPGFLFVFSTLRGTFRRSPITAQQVASNLGWLALSSAVLHTLTGIIFNVCNWPTPSFSVLMTLLIGNFGKDSELLYDALTDLTTRPLAYLTYFGAVCILGAALGFLAHLKVRTFWPNINDWHDLLDKKANRGVVDGVTLTPDVYVTAVVDMKLKDAPVLVRGLVDDWLLAPNGDLDAIILTRTYRRPLSEDRAADTPLSTTLDDRYYPIRGDYFILRRSEMITLNILYLFTVESADIAPSEQVPAPTTTLPPGEVNLVASDIDTNGSQ